MPRARLLGVATLVCGVLVAGCGAGSNSPTAATAAGAGTPTSRTATGANPGLSGPGVFRSGLLAFARCMRSNGVPSFPDPTPGAGGFRVPAGGRLSSPAFRAAQAKCHQLLPGGGPPGPGSQTHPTAQALAQMVKIAQCMRQHGISEFPDPRTSVPANPFGSGIAEISDIYGVILLFPATIDQQSPAFTQAAAACRFPLHNH